MRRMFPSQMKMLPHLKVYHPQVSGQILNIQGLKDKEEYVKVKQQFV